MALLPVPVDLCGGSSPDLQPLREALPQASVGGHPYLYICQHVVSHTEWLAVYSGGLIHC